VITCGVSGLVIYPGDQVKLVILGQDLAVDAYAAGLPGCNTVWVPFYAAIDATLTFDFEFDIKTNYHAQLIESDLKSHLTFTRLSSPKSSYRHENLDLDNLRMADVVSQIQNNRKLIADNAVLSLMVIHNWVWSILKNEMFCNQLEGKSLSLQSVIDQGHSYINARYQLGSSNVLDSNMWSNLASMNRSLNHANLGSNMFFYYQALCGIFEQAKVDLLVQTVAELMIVAKNLETLNKIWTPLNSLNAPVDNTHAQLWFAEQMVDFLKNQSRELDSI
jgi:hypothetical protein